MGGYLKLCAKCAKPAQPVTPAGLFPATFQYANGLPVCFPECVAASDHTQLALDLDLSISDRELSARNLRYTLTGAL